MGLLNAFRRHRRDHGVAQYVPNEVFGCSTPFGVIVEITGYSPCTDVYEYLLNAFRRHRRSQTSRSASRERTASAQRLSASSSRSRCADAEARPVSRLLNAFRRHRRDHGTVKILDNLIKIVLNAFRRHRRDHDAAGVRSAVGLAAQRLSASSSRSQLIGPSLFPHGVELLNAFRRHRRDHARDTGIRRRSSSVLNAFRRHRRDRH